MSSVQVCGTHMGGFMGSKVSTQGSLFQQIFLNMAGFGRNLQKQSTLGSFSAKIHYKTGYDGKLW